MHDPFPPPPTSIARLAAPVADAFSLRTLPLHVHEVIVAFLAYHAITHLVSPALSRVLFPRVYPSFPTRTRRNWDVHVVSLVQSTLICSLAIWVLREDEEIRSLGWQGRIFGYTGAAGLVQALAAGYFLWDLTLSALWLDVLGIGSLMHALSAFTVTMIGFRPFANYYGLAFILYELSTPSLNFHWFLDKLGMTGSWIQLVNGILLIITFGSCRLVWGVYQSYHIYRDMWMALQSANAPPVGWAADSEVKSAADMVKESFETDIMPVRLALLYLASNTVLILLNFYWFFKMIQAVAKRFTKPSDKKQ